MRNVKAAPYTRKLARSYGIEIETIEGTGKNKRITNEDIERTRQSSNNPTTNRTLLDTHTNKESLPFKGRRKQIAKKMTTSAYTIPHVTHFDRIDVSALIEVKDELKADGVHLSLTAFFLKAVSIALLEFPVFNSKLDEEREEITLEPTVNCGIATHTDEGLIVPVIKDTQQKSIPHLHEEMKQLTEKAQNNECEMSDLRGGTFTISNVGPIGGVYATPIINHPEVAILALHQIEDTPVVRNKTIVIRSMLNLSLSFDHRVADGYTAVMFTNRMKSLLEKPYRLLTSLK
ncbi:dihydrolipoamide acetyltransferase family protein [Geomicrobium sp. JCM 19039]|uniref:dihydrolipoamide acetyltransferase family protein n=1 Tax=Geomicrobium sp. JCM 19039 TaxID=1460636 RepID=UPI000694FD85|nr:dihydrolipoamide acetyltransferase family protein [Geomicrobium sp. JCM 19039]